MQLVDAFLVPGHGEAIEFSGALDIVTFVDRRDYGL
jgi:hypothetical protein